MIYFQRNHISTSRAKNLLLLQYPNYLDLWKIAQASPPDGKIVHICVEFKLKHVLFVELHFGQSVPLDQNPIKLIKVKKPSSVSCIDFKKKKNQIFIKLTMLRRCV